MPNAYILNQTPTGYGAAVSMFVEMLVGAGWQYLSSGDGLAAYNASGKVFSQVGSGANGWNNPKAWARLSDPSALRELVVQHGGTGALRLKYSALAKFTGGAPSATVTPSATDERAIQGGGTDATPSYCTQFFSTGVLTAIDRFQGAALAAAPHGFWFAGCRTPAALVADRGALMMDPVTNIPEDTDPVVFYACKSGTNTFKVNGSYGGGQTTDTAPGGTGQGTWGHMNAAKTSFVYVDATAFGCGGGADGGVSTQTPLVRGQGIGTNLFNGKDDATPICYARLTGIGAPTGVKGWSTLVRYTGLVRNTFIDTLNNRQWICVGNCWLPWDGVTDPQN